MDNARAMSVGFLKSSKVRNAEEAIGQSEGLLTVLRLTQADIKPAEDALQIAKRFFDSNQFAKAFHAAKKAESLAITLDERFGGYQKAAKALQSRIDSMRRLGLRTEELETLLSRAEKKVLSGIWDTGAFVPNYLEARVLVERAAAACPRRHGRGHEGREGHRSERHAPQGPLPRFDEIPRRDGGSNHVPARRGRPDERRGGRPQERARHARQRVDRRVERSRHPHPRRARGHRQRLPEGDDRHRGRGDPLRASAARGIPLVRGRGRP